MEVERNEEAMNLQTLTLLINKRTEIIVFPKISMSETLLFENRFSKNGKAYLAQRI